MTGHEHYNFHAFNRAAGQWQFGVGRHEVETPFQANSRVWRKHHGRDFDPYTDKCDYGDPILAEMLAEDLAVLCRSDAIALLSGWEKSKGARAELLLALNLGKRVFDAETGKELHLAASLSFASTDETILQEAQRLVHGDRGADYGHPIVDYRATGRMWGAILERSFGFDVPDVPPRICTVMMAAVKLSREAGKHKRDNLTDTAGYAECAAMIAEREAFELRASAVPSGEPDRGDPSA